MIKEVTIEKRKPATVFLNLGQTKSVDGEETFISLPYGLGIDNMPANKVFGTSDFQKKLAYGNQLLKQIQDMAENMEPGTEKVLKLEVHLYKAEPKEELDTSDMQFDLGA